MLPARALLPLLRHRRVIPMAFNACSTRSMSESTPEPPKPPKKGWKKAFSILQPPDEEDTRARKEKQEILMERMRRSVFYDAKQSTTEKLLIADARPLMGSDAFDVPVADLTAVPVVGPSTAPRPLSDLFNGKLTLLTVSFQAHGKQQSDVWHSPFMAAFHLDTPNPTKGIQVVDLVYLEGWLFRAFSSLMVSSTANAAQPQMKPHTYVRFETSVPATEMFCHRMKMHNRLMGYAYLVDWTGKVRWRAHGSPHETEVPSLITCATRLLKSFPA